MLREGFIDKEIKNSYIKLTGLSKFSRRQQSKSLYTSFHSFLNYRCFSYKRVPKKEGD